MRRTILRNTRTACEAVLTGGFLLVWLTVWPIYRCLPHRRLSH